MTTAHRPTWKAAVGRASQGGWNAGGAVSTAVSALEAPGQLSLKTLRKPLDSAAARKKALQESLLALEKAEAKVAPKRKLDPALEARAQQRLLRQTAEVNVQAIQAKYDDSDVEDDSESAAAAADDDDKKGNPDDEDTDLDDSDSDLDDNSDDNDDDDDEDDEAALQAELAKIRAEREEARRKAQQQQAEEEASREEKQDEAAALLGNPLLAVGTGTPATGSSGSTSKRRWNDDVVFRNQAKGEPKTKKRFINDTVRNDFHKRFLNKFIR